MLQRRNAVKGLDIRCLEDAHSVAGPCRDVCFAPTIVLRRAGGLLQRWDHNVLQSVAIAWTNAAWRVHLNMGGNLAVEEAPSLVNTHGYNEGCTPARKFLRCEWKPFQTKSAFLALQSAAQRTKRAPSQTICTNVTYRLSFNRPQCST